MQRGKLVHAKERTFVMIKPDAVQRLLVGEIIKRLRKRLKLVALKMISYHPAWLPAIMKSIGEGFL